MISLEALERYCDFVDPERTRVPYNPRQGLERLLGVLSPDPKGIVVAAMDQEWYGTKDQLKSSVYAWLGKLGLEPKVWPIASSGAWQYCERRNKAGEIIDGSLVDLGAVVRKAEDSSQTLYFRSIAGAELVTPLVQQAVKFVTKANEYAEMQRQQGLIPQRFESMWRIIGGVNSSTEHRRPLIIWDVINFLIQNPGQQRQIDMINGMNSSHSPLILPLISLGNCGIIDYQSPMGYTEGHSNKGWSVYTPANPHSVKDLDPNAVYQEIKGIKGKFSQRANLTDVLDYIKEFPESEYERGEVARKLRLHPSNISTIFSSLVELGILKRPGYGFKGGEKVSLASANDLTRIFYDMVCAPAYQIAYTLSPLSQNPWSKKEVAAYLDNYNEERSSVGPKGGEDIRVVLTDVLPKDGSEIKRDTIINLYNNQGQRRLKPRTLGYHLGLLVESGELEQPKPGYYRIIKSTH